MSSLLTVNHSTHELNIMAITGSSVLDPKGFGLYKEEPGLKPYLSHNYSIILPTLNLHIPDLV